MSAFIAMADDERKATGQSLLESRKMARSLEGLMDTLIPLLGDNEMLTLERMRHVRTQALEISQILMTIYQENARDLLGSGK